MTAPWARMAIVALAPFAAATAACGGGSAGDGGTYGSGASEQSATDGGEGGGACSSASSFPSAAVSTLTTDGGKLRVALHGAPHQPFIAGLQCVELVVTDAATGAAVDGLSVSMTPWMPAMGHGASVTPQVTPLGEGRYVFTDVSLFMPGEWELRIQFSGQVADSAAPTFNVD